MLRPLFRALLGARLPITEGELEVSGVRSPVTLRRDAHGVAYVEASTDEDAFYGMGFCQAQDRAFQIDSFVRVARGTLCEVVGGEMLPADRLMRRIGLSRVAREQLALLAPHVRAQLEAFARGVNDGARLGSRGKPHELTLMGADTSFFRASDVLAVLQFFAFALSSNWDAELARLRILRADGPEALAALEAADPEWTRGADGAARLSRDVDVLAAAERLARDAAAATDAVGLAGASNSWAIAPARTSTGRPILACDPHLTATLPAHWYLMHVRTPEWAMSGACLPSQPIVSFGHGERVAWAITAGHVDNTDLFIEKVGPDDTVLEGRDFVPCEVREEVIRIKGAPSVRERVLVTRRGPIVSPPLDADGNAGGALSMRGTWMAPRRIDGYDVYTARSVEEARRRYASYPAVSESRVFADVGGRIAWQIIGDAPVRKKGHGVLPMPGWDPEVGWRDEPLPFDQHPHAVDPERGFVASANNRPAQAPGGPFLGADWLDGHRYERIVELLAARRDWDVAAAMRMQLDRTTVLWRRLREPLVAACRGRASAEAAAGLTLLEGWDGVVSAESRAASVFELLFAEMMCRAARARAPRAWRAAIGEGTNAVLPHGVMALRRVEHLARLLIEQPEGWFRGGWPAEIADALAAVVQRLRDLAGQTPGERWAWGTIRTLTLVHPAGTKPPLGRVFNLGPIPCGGDAATIPQASFGFDHPLGNPMGIPNLRAVIDVGDWEASRYVLAGGQSGNPCSSHYGDLLGKWQRGEGIGIAWSPEEVRRRAHATLRLSPASRRRG